MDTDTTRTGMSTITVVPTKITDEATRITVVPMKTTAVLTTNMPGTTVTDITTGTTTSTTGTVLTIRICLLAWLSAIACHRVWSGNSSFMDIFLWSFGKECGPVRMSWKSCFLLLRPDMLITSSEATWFW